MYYPDINQILSIIDTIFYVAMAIIALYLGKKVPKWAREEAEDDFVPKSDEEYDEVSGEYIEYVAGTSHATLAVFIELLALSAAVLFLARAGVKTAVTHYAGSHTETLTSTSQADTQETTTEHTLARMALE